MIKTLIANNDLNIIKQFINELLNKVKNIRLEYVCTDLKEILQIISKNNLDLVILEIRKVDLTILEMLKEFNIMNFTNKIRFVIISEDISFIEEHNNYSNKYLYIIQKSCNMDVIYEKITQIANEIRNEKNYYSVKSRVVSELIGMGYDFKYAGTKYILESIMFIYRNNTLDLLNNLEKNVYKFVSYNNKKTLGNIKTSIIKSTELVNGNDGRITPKSVISEISTKIYDEIH